MLSSGEGDGLGDSGLSPIVVALGEGDGVGSSATWVDEAEGVGVGASATALAEGEAAGDEAEALGDGEALALEVCDGRADGLGREATAAPLPSPPAFWVCVATGRLPSGIA